MDQVGHNVITHPVTETHFGKRILFFSEVRLCDLFAFPDFYVVFHICLHSWAVFFVFLWPLSKITIPPGALRRGINVILNIVKRF